MLINAYCENRGWLFEDLKAAMEDEGAVASHAPMTTADAWICVRTRELYKSPNPPKTVLQFHDLEEWTGTETAGLRSYVHPVQKRNGAASFVQPIGSRPVMRSDEYPARFTVGFFCREVEGKKRSVMFAEAVRLAREYCNIDVLMIGERLDHISSLGVYEKRAAEPQDYNRIHALAVLSESPMIPLSAYEMLTAGRPVITTPRKWADIGIKSSLIHEVNTVSELARTMQNLALKDYAAPAEPPHNYSRKAWAKKQVEYARSLVTK